MQTSKMYTILNFIILFVFILLKKILKINASIYVANIKELISYLLIISNKRGKIISYYRDLSLLSSRKME